MKTSFLISVLLLLLSSVSFATEGLKSDSVKSNGSTVLPRMLELGSVGCIPCMKMAPIVDSLKKEYEGVVSIEFYDVKKDPNQARAFKIQLIPTQIFLTNEGKEFFRHTGFFEKDSIEYIFNQMKVAK